MNCFICNWYSWCEYRTSCILRKIIKVFKNTYTNTNFLDKNFEPILINIKDFYNSISTKDNIIHSKIINTINNNLIYIKLLDSRHLTFQKKVFNGDVNILFINSQNNFSKTISVYSTDNFSIIYSKLHNYLNYNCYYLKTNEDIYFCDINKKKLDINFLNDSIDDYIYKAKNNKKYMFITKSNIYKFK